VWVALRGARAVRLALWEGTINVGPGRSLATPPAPLAVGGTSTVRVGASLHIAVVTATPLDALLPGRLYSYLVSFGADSGVFDDSRFTASEDLKSEGLLLDEDVGGKPHVALGYDQGELPSFAMPPPELTDLRILHGSCRRLGHPGADGLPWVDDRILAWRKDPDRDPRTRPHQLILTGDQIYADDVALPLLPVLTTVGNELMGVVERLPTRFPVKANDPRAAELQDEKKADELARRLNDECPRIQSRLLREAPLFPDDSEPFPDDQLLSAWPADLAHFPAGLRKNVLFCEARYTTVDPESHLMSLAEFCAMYLLAWCNEGWPTKDGQPVLPPLTEQYTLPTSPAQRSRIWELHTAGLPREGTDRLKALENALERLRKRTKTVEGYPKTVEILKKLYGSLPRVRRALANVPTLMVFDDHDVTDDWNISRAWRDAVHSTALGRAMIRNGLVAYALFQGWGSDPERYPRFGGEGGEAAALKQLLADPEPFFLARDSANGVLLLAAQGLFPEGAAPGPDPTAARIADRLLGLAKPDEPPATRWHWSLDGPHHRVIALDTRTRRDFRSRYGPSALVSSEALLEQLPPDPQVPLPAGIEVLVLVSQTPVLVPTVASAIVLAIKGRIEDARHFRELRQQTGTDPDNEIWPGDPVALEELLRRLAPYRRVVVLSGEVHHAYSAALSYWAADGEQRLFDAGAELAGELGRCRLPDALRSAFAAQGRPLGAGVAVTPRPGHGEWLVDDEGGKVQYLLRRERDTAGGNHVAVILLPPPSRIVQFVSSGLKNTISFVAMLATGYGAASRLYNLPEIERLTWDETAPPPLDVPEGAQLPPSVRESLRSSPVLVNPRGWPQGTTAERRADTAWRQAVLVDERPDAARPKQTAAAALEAEFDPRDVPKSYASIARRHASLLDDALRHSRTVLHTPNLGLVRFEHADGGPLIAIQELFAGQNTPATVHRAPLEVAGEAPPRLVFGEDGAA
jgi:hypothetical protein